MITKPGLNVYIHTFCVEYWGTLNRFKFTSVLRYIRRKHNWAATWQNNKMTVRPAKTQISLIWVFAGRTLTLLVLSRGGSISCVYCNMPGKNGSVRRDLILLLLKCTFLLLQHSFFIHNGNRKLKLAIVSANIVNFYFITSDCHFLYCLMDIFWKMWKKKSLQSRVLERVTRVTVNKPKKIRLMTVWRPWLFFTIRSFGPDGFPGYILFLTTHTCTSLLFLV